MQLLRNLVAPFVAASILSACTINVHLPLAPNEEQAAATIVAQTLQALGKPLGTPPASSPTITPTYTPPKLSITGNSNCRTGPGAGFKAVTAFVPGTILDLVGKDSANNYWQVKIPNSQETCWVWGQYATATGSYDSLPESAPVSSGGGAPARPGSLFYTYTRPFGNLTTELTWSDAADNETGYRVYRFDLLLADLPANSTTYTDVESVTPGTDLQYSVEAYNGSGASPQRTISFKCQ